MEVKAAFLSCRGGGGGAVDRMILGLYVKLHPEYCLVESCFGHLHRNPKPET